MDFLVAARTNKGNVKSTNQDSVLMIEANTGVEKVMLLAVCDGMGGLLKGELASATMIKGFAAWFAQEFPALAETGISIEVLRKSWSTLIETVNARIYAYGGANGINLGTTLAAILLYGNQYFGVNIGDSRIYKIDKGIRQLTKDQTLVQQEADSGRITPAEAENDIRRNILTQCVGASYIVKPVFLSGKANPGSVFLVCSDGFRHTVSKEEFLEKMAPAQVNSEAEMGAVLEHFIGLNMARGEEDNISAVLLKVQ